jgi:SAM-dependent methyltransferase
MISEFTYYLLKYLKKNSLLIKFKSILKLFTSQILKNVKFKHYIKKLIDRFSPDFVNYHGIILPEKDFRAGGSEFKNDNFFFKSALLDTDRLIKDYNLNSNTRILDIGCGAGRLPIGIIYRIGEIKKYRGIDVIDKFIKWCSRHITQIYPNFQFCHIDVKNLRYNPHGEILDKSFSFPFHNDEFDIIYLGSVFTHMVMEDIKIYLKDIKRILNPSGVIFLTAFIEDNVSDVTINPKNSLMNYSGPLHCVQYNKNYFISMLENSGFKIDKLGYKSEYSGQSTFKITLI